MARFLKGSRVGMSALVGRVRWCEDPGEAMGLELSWATLSKVSTGSEGEIMPESLTRSGDLACLRVSMVSVCSSVCSRRGLRSLVLPAASCRSLLEGNPCLPLDSLGPWADHLIP